MSQTIKAVLFDHDDTLVGTIEAKWAQHKHVARTFYGKELADDEIREHWGIPFSKLVTVLYGDDDPKRAMKRNLSCEDDFPKSLLEDSIPTLQRLHMEGKLIGIITATSRFSFELDLKLNNFPRDIIDYTQTEEDALFYKPDPRVFDSAVTWLAEQNVVPSEALYIGDGLRDMKAALGAGFNFIGVTTGLVGAEQFRDAGAVAISRLRELSLKS
jgi:phosphoglycolate phosphatase-like HAD superfamily hydrolase